jgi:hypothetical protein
VGLRLFAWSSITPQLEKCIGSNSFQDFRRKLSINGGGIGGAVEADAAKRKRWFGFWCGHSAAE